MAAKIKSERIWYEVLRLVKNKQMAAKANSYGSDACFNKEAKSNTECVQKQKEMVKRSRNLFLLFFDFPLL